MNIVAVEKEIKRFKDKICKIEDEIKSLNIEKTNLFNQLTGLEKALSLIGKQTPITARAELRQNSEMSKIRDLLLKEGRPLHIDEIIALLGAPGDNKKRALSLTGSLGSYVAKKRVFTRPTPNTFDLIDRETNKDDSSKKQGGNENL